MKKQDIKKDPIRDRMLGVINNINDNPKPFLQFSSIVLISLLTIIVFSNRSNNKLDEYNLNSSINQNRYIDGDRETALNNFNNIISNYSKSESLNQALIYLLNDAIENNNIDTIENLINDNNFNTSDKTLQSLFYNILGNYYSDIGNTEEAINFYNKAINSSHTDDHGFQFKLNLLYLFYNIGDYKNYTSILKDIDIDSIVSFQLKSKFEQLPIVN
tara:strand:+ start:52 stop:699 length:648 start_codon:yes stop_codon:yes gene_type:complete